MGGGTRNVTLKQLRALLSCYGWVHSVSGRGGHESWTHPGTGVKCSLIAHQRQQGAMVASHVLQAMERAGTPRAEVRKWLAECS